MGPIFERAAVGNRARGLQRQYYYYLDNTPTHSYMKYLYKYPHAANHMMILSGSI